MAIYENISLDKGLYSTGRGFLAELEAIDPSENYRGTSLEGLDAFERQLKRFNIKVSGSDSDMIEKFFSTANSAALFPEYISRAVRKGKEYANVLPYIVASTTSINGMDYRGVTSVPAEADKQLSPVAEGSAIPETNITLQENLVHLQKRGRMLVASYEAIRFQRLDVFTVMLRQIGAYIARQQFKDAVNVLINGDGNSNPAEVTSVASSGNLVYTDLVNLWNSFDPYEMTTLIATTDATAAILSMSEMRDAAAGLNFHASGEVVTPLGAKLIKGLSEMSGSIIALDKSCALEMVTAGDVLTEYDKLIDRQLERAAITEIAGFSKIITAASKVLTL